VLKTISESVGKLASAELIPFTEPTEHFTCCRQRGFRMLNPLYDPRIGLSSDSGIRQVIGDLKLSRITGVESDVIEDRKHSTSKAQGASQIIEPSK
jgi:hypothetical protein